MAEMNNLVENHNIDKIKEEIKNKLKQEMTRNFLPQIILSGYKRCTNTPFFTI